MYRSYINNKHQQKIFHENLSFATKSTIKLMMFMMTYACMLSFSGKYFQSYLVRKENEWTFEKIHLRLCAICCLCVACGIIYTLYTSRKRFNLMTVVTLSDSLNLFCINFVSILHTFLFRREHRSQAVGRKRFCGQTHLSAAFFGFVYHHIDVIWCGWEYQKSCRIAYFYC